MTLPVRNIAVAALFLSLANGALADPNKIGTDATKQCQASCAPKRSDATQYEGCLLECRKPEVAQKFLAEKQRQQEQGDKK